MELDEIDEDELHFYIHDRDTGLLIDTRIEEVLIFLYPGIRLFNIVKNYNHQGCKTLDSVLEIIKGHDKRTD